MIRKIVFAVIIAILVVEIIEHLIFPVIWFIFKGRQKSVCGVAGIIGKVAVIKRWQGNKGQVMINGELWRAVCDVPLSAGEKALITGVQGLTLSLKPIENQGRDA